jgi:hypothetical protein
MSESLDTAWSNREPQLTYLLFDPFTLRYRGQPALRRCPMIGLPMPSEIAAGTR